MLVRAICLHSQIVKERKASGNLKNGHPQPKCAGFANNSPATFTVTKTKNRDAYDVTIPFFDSMSEILKVPYKGDNAEKVLFLS